MNDDELLEELAKRVRNGKIKVSSKYYYDIDEIRFIFEGENTVKSFFNCLNVEKQFNYYQNYKTYCQPLQNQLEQKKEIKKIENLKINNKI